MLAAHAAMASFLTGGQFPKTFDDVSFVDRMAVLRAGYEDWEPEYDDNGRCIRGCAYAGMKIEDDLEQMRRQTDIAAAQLQSAGITIPTTSTTGVGTSAPTVITTPTTTTAIPTLNHEPPKPNNGVKPTAHGNASGGHNKPTRPDKKGYPIGAPLAGDIKITSPFGDRIHPVTHKRTPHRGVDLSASLGTNVMSPAAGTVASVWTDDTCGRGVRITHSGGFETVYCHLNKQLVSQGDAVCDGCTIAQSGNTGRSTGPHLHYGIKHNGTYIDPTEYIKAK